MFIIKKLNLSNFDTNKIADMRGMLRGCSPKLSLICENDLIKKEYIKKNN